MALGLPSGIPPPPRCRSVLLCLYTAYYHLASPMPAAQSAVTSVTGAGALELELLLLALLAHWDSRLSRALIQAMYLVL
jgi:hypothetical protein